MSLKQLWIDKAFDHLGEIAHPIRIVYTCKGWRVTIGRRDPRHVQAYLVGEFKRGISREALREECQFTFDGIWRGMRA